MRYSEVIDLGFSNKRNILIVFTIKNTRTDNVYVGTTKDSIDERWAVYQLAKDLPIEAPLYSEMRKYGVVCFTIEEYDFAETREELAELFAEAMTQFDGISLKGTKTSMPRTAVYPTSEGAVPKVKAEPKVAVKKETSTQSVVKTVVEPRALSAVQATAKTRSNLSHTESADPKVKLKLATGRTGSAIKEKRIKEAIALEKQERAAKKSKQIQEQSDEMKSILANLDARGSTLRKRH